MDESQRAMVGAEIAPMFEAMARERLRASGGDRKSGSATLREPIPDGRRTRDDAAAAVNVSAANPRRGARIAFARHDLKRRPRPMESEPRTLTQEELEQATAYVIQVKEATLALSKVCSYAMSRVGELAQDMATAIGKGEDPVRAIERFSVLVKANAELLHGGMAAVNEMSPSPIVPRWLFGAPPSSPTTEH